MKLLKKNMGYGKNFYVGKPKKNWKKVRQGTSAHFSQQNTMR